MPFDINPIPSDRVRVPDPRKGVATVVSRYRRERAVVLHPDDFHRLDALEAFVAEAATARPLRLSAAAIAAHRAADTPGTPITDPQMLRELFG